jgi:DNA-binding beta-propeller fold protein YncE
VALDARGNLYVANIFSNQVLVYDPNYVQQAGKMITAGLSAPVGVAFDSKGNVYVANQTGGGGTGSITQYSSASLQNSRFLITDGIAVPFAITVDGLDDLHVVNVASESVYPLADNINGPFLLTSVPLPECIDGCAIAVHRGDLYVGARDGGWEKAFISELLAGNNRFPVFQSTNGGVAALATDSSGDLYVVTGNEVDYWGPKGGPALIFELGFEPAGIAVDTARGRIYLSNLVNNQVLVYSTKGTLLYTIR